MLFNVICADPPWKFSDKLTMSDVKRGAESNYTVLTIDKLCEIPVKDIVDKNSFCCIWVPNSLIDCGLKLMKEWGFEQKGIYGWIKKSSKSGKLAFGMGRSFRGVFEIALYGRKGKLEVSNKSQRNIEIDDNFDFDDNLKHSKKPEKLQDSLDLMFPNTKKLELFARRKRNGWECVGLELGENVFDSIARLKIL
jgi:N6-adenosine-specific RNA methylase IME4